MGTKKLIIMPFLCALPFMASAYDFRVNNLCYDITSARDKTVTVTNEKSYGYNTSAYENLSGDIVVPSEITYGGITYKVSSISDYSFYNCQNITSLSIPEGVVTIGVGACQNCRGLKTLNLPSTLMILNFYCFENCNSMESVTCDAITPPLCLGMNTLSFNSVKSVCRVFVPQGSVSAYQHASGWDKLPINAKPDSNFNGLNYKILYNGTVEVISPNYGTYSGNIAIPDEVYVNGKLYPVSGIGDGAFKNSTGLQSVVIPDGMSSIGNNAFENCIGLTSIKIPYNISKIGTSAFKGCSNLSVVDYFSETGDATALGGPTSMWLNPVFSDCDALTTINIGNTVKSIPDCIFKYAKIKTLNIPDNVTEIVNDAFAECHNLKELTLGAGLKKMHNACFGLEKTSLSSLETVYYNAVKMEVYSGNQGIYYPFYNSTFHNLVIGENVISLPTNAFNECSYINMITCHAVIPPTLGNNCFTNVKKNQCVLRVPKASVNLYKSAAVWRNFKIESIEPDTEPSSLYMDDAEAFNYGETTLELKLRNNFNICSFQFDIKVPNGLNIATNENGQYKIELADQRSNGHLICSNRLSDNIVRVVCFSLANKPLKGNEGVIISMTFDCDGAPLGEHNLHIYNVHLSDANSNDIALPSTTCKLSLQNRILSLGDTNADNVISISDAVNVVNHILELPTKVFAAEAADVNKDGIITVADAAGIVDIILGKNIYKSSPQNIISAYNISSSDNLLTATYTPETGDTGIIDLSLKNMTPFTALQMDIILPDGMHIQKTDDEYDFRMSKRFSNTHVLQSNLIDNNTVRLVIFSIGSEQISGNDGIILSFPVESNSIISNDNKIKLSKIRFTTLDAQDVVFSDIVISLFTTGIENLCEPSSVTPQYYNVHGQRIYDPVPGIYIIRQGTKVSKIIIR